MGLYDWSRESGYALLINFILIVCEPAHVRIVDLPGLLQGIQILFRAYHFGAL